MTGEDRDIAQTKAEYAVRFFIEVATNPDGIASAKAVSSERSRSTEYRAQKDLEQAGLVTNRFDEHYELDDEGKELLKRLKRLLPGDQQ